MINCTDGRYCLDLNSNGNEPPGSVSMALFLTAGQPYRFMIDLGALDASCKCESGLPFRNLSVSVTDTSSSASIRNWTAAIDTSCRWLYNLTFDVTVPSSDVTFDIASGNPITPCGPWIDNVRLWWLPCVDGR